MGTRSKFFAASVFAFAFSTKPTRIVNTFESVLTFALCSSLTFSEVETWMLDDDGFGNSVTIALVTD